MNKDANMDVQTSPLQLVWVFYAREFAWNSLCVWAASFIISSWAFLPFVSLPHTLRRRNITFFCIMYTSTSLPCTSFSVHAVTTTTQTLSSFLKSTNEKKVWIISCSCCNGVECYLWSGPIFFTKGATEKLGTKLVRALHIFYALNFTWKQPRNDISRF